MAQLAEGLHHAHERGVLHRDIKPSNILISSDGQPLLLDFNLAQHQHVYPTQATLGGTVAYMAPEHLRALSARSAALARLSQRAMAKQKQTAPKPEGLQVLVIKDIFTQRFKSGITRVPFSRSDLLEAAKQFAAPGESEQARDKNLGDILYTFRFRRDFPEEILGTAPKGKIWVILGTGISKYELRLITKPNLSPSPNWVVTKVHDSTPEIVRRFVELSDEQAALSRICYNRLVDLFCRCVAHSLQNHLRTTVKGVGQIEIDELYVGANRMGQHFIIPVQAKKEKDRVGVSQLIQDYEYCKIKHPGMIPRLLAAQLFAYQENGKTFDRVAICEFVVREAKDDLLIEKSSEEHFLLLPKSLITQSDFKAANIRADKEGQ